MEKLRERGLSRRQAVRGVNAFFEAMKKTLKRDGAVKSPFGKLVRVPNHLGPAAQRRRYTVAWEPDALRDWLEYPDWHVRPPLGPAAEPASRKGPGAPKGVPPDAEKTGK